MITCTRRFQFCAGHRLKDYDGRCANLHGHNYIVYVEAAAEPDRIGMVVDFGLLKARIGAWIEENWDHGFLYWDEDEATAAALQQFSELSGWPQRSFALPYNPTAENLARFLHEVVCPDCLQDVGVRITRVTVHETENCSAEIRPDQ